MKRFELLAKLVQRARRSGFWLFLLNLALARIIPFNRPHGFSVAAIGGDFVCTRARYRRVNHNHVRGIHACAIATIAEFSAGSLLLCRLAPRRYRLIMARLEVDYRYQAKTDIISTTTLSDRQLRDLLLPLQKDPAVTVELESAIHDSDKNEIARARTTWQIKRWDQVRTRI